MASFRRRSDAISRHQSRPFANRVLPCGPLPDNVRVKATRSVAFRIETESSVAHCSNTARQALRRLVFCRRKQDVVARTLGISPANAEPAGISQRNIPVAQTRCARCATSLRSGRACLHDGILLIMRAPSLRHGHVGKLAKDPSPNVIFLTLDRSQHRLWWRGLTSQ